MSREKQIEEMADKLCTTSYFCSTEDWDSCNQADGEYCDRCRKLAERLYNAGYRKQSEGEWVDQYNGKYANPIYVCSLCGKGTLLTPYINELNSMEMTQALSPFCPNCGTKMKGGAE
jgi:hypothetical protein